MGNRKGDSVEELCDELAGIITNYRRGEIPRPNSDHVLRWITQFPAQNRVQILKETTHILGKSYVTKRTVKRFLNALSENQGIVGSHPRKFWEGVSFLRLQRAGNSQRDFIDLLDSVLQEKFGLSIGDCGRDPSSYVYIDDAIYTGGRIRGDLVRWIENEAPQTAKVDIIALAMHTGGEWYARKTIREASQKCGKNIELHWWRSITIEDRKSEMEKSDVFRPSSIPQEAQVYVQGLGFAPVLRAGGNTGPLNLFSSGLARDLIEQEFLKKGLEIRGLCPLLPEHMRPLGCSTLKTTGFGATLATYRNCPNNAPLVFWAGSPWYPLLPRKIN